MRTPVRTLAVVALIVAFAGAAPAFARTHPQAVASGGDVVVLRYPSLVKSRVDRVKRALRRALDAAEDGRDARAAAKLAVVRRQLAAAWRGARYIVRTTPPPPADEASAWSRATASGDGPTGPTKAAPADTAFLVLGSQHDVAAAMIELTDGIDDAGLFAVAATLGGAVSGRDRAVDDIVRLAPEDPSAEEARVRPVAMASGDGPVASTFHTVMPQVLDDLDDEAGAIEGLTGDATDVTAAGRDLLARVARRIAETRATVNGHWPPVPAED